jgi:hypothetical protein
LIFLALSFRSTPKATYQAKTLSRNNSLAKAATVWK